MYRPRPQRCLRMAIGVSQNILDIFVKCVLLEKPTLAAISSIEKRVDKLDPVLHVIVDS